MWLPWQPEKCTHLEPAGCDNSWVQMFLEAREREAVYRNGVMGIGVSMI